MEKKNWIRKMNKQKKGKLFGIFHGGFFFCCFVIIMFERNKQNEIKLNDDISALCGSIENIKKMFFFFYIFNTKAIKFLDTYSMIFFFSCLLICLVALTHPNKGSTREI